MLTVLLITNRFRRRVKVFISKHFFANKYEYRDEWIKVTKALQTCHHGSVTDNLCKVMADSIGVADCMLLKASATGQLTVISEKTLACNDEQLLQLKSIVSFCQAKQWIIDVSEYEQNPALYQPLTLDIEPLKNARMAIMVPIYQRDKLYGLFVLSRLTEAPILNWEDRDFLFAVSKQLANYLFLQQAQEELAQTQQFAMFNQMSAFVLHDLKNIEAQLALIITNSKHHRNNPEFILDVFDTVNAASQRLNKVINQLRNKGSEIQPHEIDNINLCLLLRNISELCNQRKPKVDIECAPEIQIQMNKERLKSVLLHLIQNAQDACESKGEVKVFADVNGQHNGNKRVIIKIIDTGCGMSEQFIKEKLFKPFVTTKGNAGMGIGAFEAKQFIQQHNGDLSVQSCLEKGSTFTVNLPVSSVS